MKTLTMLGLTALAIGTITLSSPVQAEPGGHYGRSKEYDIGNTGHHKDGDISSTSKGEKTTSDGKRLPGRDCKLYEGATRSHGWPQYEIGNPGRPECPPETK